MLRFARPSRSGRRQRQEAAALERRQREEEAARAELQRQQTPATEPVAAQANPAGAAAVVITIILMAWKTESPEFSESITRGNFFSPSREGIFRVHQGRQG